MTLPSGLPVWAYIVVAALTVVSNIATAIWTDRKGRERDRATRGEITNNHDKPLRDVLDSIATPNALPGHTMPLQNN